jgi:exopolysaccharide production protein ExoZ
MAILESNEMTPNLGGPSDKKRFDGLQVLRGVAVMLVIWAHVKHTGDFKEVAWIMNAKGHVGVDVFFVISGFVISMSAESLKFNPVAFFVHRFARIAPLFWVTSLPLIAIALAKGIDESTWKGVATTFTFLPLFDFGAFTPPTNNFGWTLCYEFWFYMAFALMLALFGRHAWKGLLIGFALGTAGVSLFYEGGYYLPVFLFGPLVYEFLAGVLVFHLASRIGPRCVLLAFVCVLALGAYILSGQVSYGDFMGNYSEGIYRLVFFGGFGVSLVVLFIGLDNVFSIAWPKWALTIGDCSYSIYLLQAYALAAAIKLERWFVLPAWVSGLFFVVLTLGLGIAVSRGIEMQMTRGVRSYLITFLHKAGFGSSSHQIRPVQRPVAEAE